jgi:hypothetical protein
MSTRSGRRLRAAIATIGGLALAATLLAAAPAAAASPTACRVRNLDTGVTKASLQKAHNAAKAGQRLSVRGTCVGVTVLRKSLTITGIRTDTSGKPTLDAKLNGRVLNVNPGVKVTLKGVTIRNGAVDWGGSGVSNYGTLILRDVIVRGNTAERCAGIGNSGSLTLEGITSVRQNTVSWFGGGVCNAGTLTLKDSSSIRRNTAGPGLEAAYGGGLVNQEGSVVVMRGESAISDNQADRGGGVSNGGTLTMRDTSAISGNRASSGGGVYNWQTLTMRDSSAIARNSADGFGGGVANRGTLKMRGSSRITGNQAALLGSGYRGGGVWSQGDVTLDGVRCPMPGAMPNVSNNTPDDCWPDPMLP